MSGKTENNKKDIAILHFALANHVSENKEISIEFLKSEGVNTDRLISEGLRRIKKMKLLAQAKKTALEMEASKSIKDRAIAWVDQMMDKIDFSLKDLLQKEGLSMSFRNLESCSKEDIRDILIRHYTLKFMDSDKDQEDEF